ncbi:aspartate kinase [Cerasibacillus quisquiliarum]|uniref:Aspartokinase n=1 Tax=Cerasibacillus quisquiliarum TaxID=227865 RepID=A0A511UWY6_9BACI|nr:aspartate kinase [Cerasibacillus quisquiliarum]MBB5145455.1 aspartate kinase [Cerasibacillus quisquiliarum]GEN31150.1 aspartokinase 3 [Cerasibacillus quisquiliarum]
MKVVKFGGTSVADAKQIKKVGNIIKQDAERKFIVVSAPGKSVQYPNKITDQLIAFYYAENKQDKDFYLQSILERFDHMTRELEIDTAIVSEIEATIEAILHHDKDEELKLDEIKAIGEDSSAKIISSYLRKIGVDATYLNPKDAGIIVSKEPGNAQILPESYDNLYRLRHETGRFVIPGFFGYTHTNELVTFSRGGSDITGSIVAAGVRASLYENFTDVDSVYTVNPNIVPHPKKIDILTYKEMRELSYAGFSVFHDEALMPAFKSHIPVAIKNTNNPDSKGTYIVRKRKHHEECVVGIASDTGFSSLYVRKYLMNREIGFGRKLFSILEDEGVSFEHAPSGIDDMSVIIRDTQLTQEKEKNMIQRIQTELNPDTVQLEHGFAMIMIVGEGMMNTPGIAHKATTALKQAGVNIRMINQGSSEVSMMFGILESDINKAIISLYDMFFQQK